LSEGNREFGTVHNIYLEFIHLPLEVKNKS